MEERKSSGPIAKQFAKGGPLTTEIRMAELADARAVSLVLAQAFEEDPFMSWMFPEPKFRLKLIQAWMRVEVNSAIGMASGWVSVDDGEIIAGTIWAPPGRDLHEGDIFNQLWYLVLGANPDRTSELAEGLSMLGDTHPAEPHFYLNTVGVAPNCKGQGHGGTIIHHTLDLADNAGHPCYLESSSPRNVPLYERLGFDVVKEINLPNGPTMWGMWRPER
ncbi:MAG: GNAT family N-acetyltransferase [Acidimicrobiales bacterium]|nr:GNAT family N-acetyltransferase [Acidimicrobiales bacterium]